MTYHLEDPINLASHFMRIPNALLEYTYRTRLNGRPLRTLLMVIRYTFGYNRKWTSVSRARLADEMGITERSIRRGLAELEGQGLIVRSGRWISIADHLWVPQPQTDAQSMSYDDYLKTEHWKHVAGQAKVRARHRCQLCNGDGELHVHHRTYERLGNEQPEDLTVLCSNCHTKYHADQRSEACA